MTTQLETLCQQLGIPQFIPQLSGFRDELIRDNAASQQSLLAAKDAEIAALRNLPVPEAPLSPPIISQLNAAFESALTPEQRIAFAAPYAIVRSLVEAGQMVLAAGYIASVAVPLELEAAKAELLQLLTP